MATLTERVGDRALADAIETLREQKIQVDETPYLRVDNRHGLVKVLNYAWQWIIDMMKATGACLEKHFIRPLFSNAALRQAVPLFASREEDPHAGLNAFLHLSGMMQVMLSVFGSLEYACKSVPLFDQKLRENQADLSRSQLRGSLEEALSLPEVKAVLKDSETKKKLIRHLQIVKEWELFLDESERARVKGDIMYPQVGRFMSKMVYARLKNVDVVELFNQVIQALPFSPDFYGFEIERAKEEETGEEFISDEYLPSPSDRDSSIHRIHLNQEPKGVISLPFTPNVGVGFDHLKGQYFTPSSESVRWSSQDDRRKMRVFDRKRYFQPCPSDVYFPIQRLRQEKKGHAPGKLTFHRDHLQIPLQTTLPKRVGEDRIEQVYDLEDFIAFQGDVERGHYAYFKKQGQLWFECINARMRLVSKRTIGKILNDRSVLHHYVAIKEEQQ